MLLLTDSKRAREATGLHARIMVLPCSKESMAWVTLTHQRNSKWRNYPLQGQMKSPLSLWQASLFPTSWACSPRWDHLYPQSARERSAPKVTVTPKAVSRLAKVPERDRKGGLPCPLPPKCQKTEESGKRWMVTWALTMWTLGWRLGAFKSALLFPPLLWTGKGQERLLSI